MFPTEGGIILQPPTVFKAYLFELPSIDLSLQKLFDLAFVFTDYSEYLSFLKNGVPLLQLFFMMICGFVFPLPFALISVVRFRSGIFLFTMLQTAQMPYFFREMLLLEVYLEGWYLCYIQPWHLSQFIPNLHPAPSMDLISSEKFQNSHLMGS